MVRLIPACDACGVNAIKKWTNDRERWFWSCPSWPSCSGETRAEDFSSSLRRHPNWGIRAAGLTNRDVPFLFHFTDVENLPLIVEHQALLSWDEQERRGFHAPRPGGSEDSRRLAALNGDLDRISTSVVANIPMLAVRMRTGARMAIIVLNPAAADLPGVLFTSTNANASDHWRAEPPRGFGAIDFKLATGPVEWSNPRWKRAVQAEILVPVQIDISHFFAVVFRTEDDLAEARRNSRLSETLEVMVEPDLFPDVW